MSKRKVRGNSLIKLSFLRLKSSWQQVTCRQLSRIFTGTNTVSSWIILLFTHANSMLSGGSRAPYRSLILMSLTKTVVMWRWQWSSKGRHSTGSLTVSASLTTKGTRLINNITSEEWGWWGKANCMVDLLALLKEMDYDNHLHTCNMEDHTDRRYSTILMEIRVMCSQLKSRLIQVDGLPILEKQ